MNTICSPALLYLILAVFGLIGMYSHNFELTTILLKVLFIAVWTWFLNFLCMKGHTTVSWVLVLLPFIIFFIMLMFAYEIIKRHR